MQTSSRVLRKNSAALVHLLVLGGYFLATLLFTWPLAANLTTAIPGDSFDGWQNYWNQWWIKQALVDRLVWPLYADILYAPTGVNLYFQTLNPFNGISTLPIQLTGGLIAAYNAVVFLSWVLGGYGMFLLAWWVIGQRDLPRTSDAPGTLRLPGTLAAFMAGLVYTLSPFHMAHLLGHMQVMSLEWLPFYILYLLRALQQSRGTRSGGTAFAVPARVSRLDLVPLHRPWLRTSLLAGLFLVFNGLCDWYFVLYLLLFTGLAIAWQWGTEVRRSRIDRGTGDRRAASILRILWATIRPALVAAAVFLVLLSFWLVPMVQEARQFRFMVRPPADLYILSASVMDFLVPNRLHTLFRPESFAWIGNQIAPISERTISIGYLALALAIGAGVVAWRKAAFWWVAALLFFVLALGPQLHAGNITWASIPPAVTAGQEVPSWTPYTLLNQLVPFMRISRSVSRFALMVQLCIAVLAGIGLHTLFTWLGGRQRTPVRAYTAIGAAAGVAIVVILGEYWVAPYPLSPPDTPAYYEQLAQDPDTRAVLNLPMNYDRPGYLLYQTVHGKPLTVAYISREDPRTLTERVPVLQQFRHLGDDIIAGDPAAVAPTVFADLRVGTVVLDRYKMPGGLEREYTEGLVNRIFAGQEPIYADDRITVYRVLDAIPAPAQPYLELSPRNWGPRQVDDGGQPYRALTGPAAVEVMHAAAPVAVTIRYRTEGDGTATVQSLDGAKVLAELPPVPGGAEVTVQLQPTATVTGLTLQPAAAGTVYVEQVRLEQ
jgi:hypothetical protein